jgi:hypothetical protein
MFYAGTLGYYAQLQALSYIAGLGSKGHYQLGAGIGTIGYEPNVSYLFGFPRAIQTGGVVFDIPIIYNTGMGDGDVEKKKQFTTQVGVISSTLEHATPEQMFATDDPDAEQPDAISAVKALQIASAEGQRVYQITQENMSIALANINHDQETMDEIEASLNAGKEVITHTDAVSVPGWSGAGYIIIDPDTGAGAYKISGGTNGAFLLFLGALLMVLGLFFITSFGVLLFFYGIHAFIAGAILLLSGDEAQFSFMLFSAVRILLLAGGVMLVPFEAVGTVLGAIIVSILSFIGTLF